MKQFLLTLVLVGPAFAETCPEVTDHTEALDELIIEVQSTRYEWLANQIASEMWQYWTDAPDERSQELLDEGMKLRWEGDLDGAEEPLTELVEYCPHFAEGYNQRAAVNYLRGDFKAALPDLDKAIEITPRHIAALSGRALTLIGLRRKADAAVSLRAALVLNPWLAERDLLPELVKAEEAERAKLR